MIDLDIKASIKKGNHFSRLNKGTDGAREGGGPSESLQLHVFGASGPAQGFPYHN